MSFPSFLHRRKSLLFLFAILLLGLLVRLPFLELSRFEHEQVRDIVFSERILKGDLVSSGFSAKLGEDSLQQSFGPFYYYLVALALAFVPPSSYPLAISMLAMILSLLAVLFCYLFCRRYFSERVAVIASLLFSLAPWYVLHASTVLSNGTILPFFVILYFYFLSRVIVEGKLVFLIPAAVVLALQTQIHLSSLLLFPVTLVLLLLYRREVFTNTFFYMGLGSAFVLYIPYLIYNLSRSDLVGAFAFLFARYSSTFWTTFVEAVAVPFMFVTPYVGTYLLGTTEIYPMMSVKIVYSVFTVGLVLLLMVALLSLLWRFFHVKGREQKLLGTLLAWFFVPILLTILSRTNVSPHYLHVVYPVQFIALALLFDSFWKRYRGVIISIIVFVSVLYLLFLGIFYVAVDREGGTTSIYGVPLKYRLAVVDSIKQDADTLSPPIVYYGSPKRNFTYLFQISGMAPEVVVINSTAEFTRGYLIFDDFDFYSYGDRAMPAEEKERILALDGVMIKHIKVIKK